MFQFIFSVSIILIFFSKTTLGGDNCLVTDYDQIETALQTCKNIVIDSIIVPAKRELTLNIRDGTNLTFRGNISFEKEFWKGPLVRISGSNFYMRGEEGSVFDGNGPLYWDGLGTWGKTNKPKFMKINVHNATMENINLRNCPVACVVIKGSDNLTIRNWVLDLLDGDEGVAPPNKFGHNTDGFTIGSETNNLLIEDTTVYNQDDCVSITNGENITIRNIFCHGSHGLSINGEGKIVKNVLITDSVITNAQNGIHVKTHLGSPPGLIQNVTYKDIKILDSKSYGVRIHQNYKNLSPGHSMDDPPENSVKIYDLNFINIFGNVQNGAIPVYILCADEGCFDWTWEGVRLYGARSNNCTGYTPEGFSC
ncbi:unnamed protein product [Ceutorhynchus assimilis]|uniref:endo-polygalacturonase n=1 Tax=Ceutorhynchus assimilis TaxID=467358 RepID=A0A9N9MXR0_9CUCU|nr:unnamed protein product [Ceutorhynchus assimilis]